MGLDVKQFREYVVDATLAYLAPEIPDSLAAQRLLMGTALHESRLTYLDQLSPGPGPALGLWQIEASSHRDLWYSWLEFRPEIAHKVNSLAAPHPSRLEQLRTNAMYACAMARVHYRRVREPLPPGGNIRALAEYAKTYFNTWQGKALVEDYARAIEVAVDAER